MSESLPGQCEYPDCCSPRPQIALIDKAVCIGCTLCIQACPVDAIVGCAKQLHAVIESLCTGCECCLPPCPVECIRMELPVPDSPRTGADAARMRYEWRNERLARDAAERAERLAQAHRARAAPQESAEKAEAAKKAAIAAAQARARAKRGEGLLLNR
ncbi:MAG: RnfABCDGE type electron transport complex subunit B [Betaproteobacteria bacterium]|nr:RnfABCDGE type electron transport complex subunit B [Betaproteobacteria bacterium]